MLGKIEQGIDYQTTGFPCNPPGDHPAWVSAEPNGYPIPMSSHPHEGWNHLSSTLPE